MDTFVPFPKIPRWSRDIIITEKIDGTNASICIDPLTNEFSAASRSRWIQPGNDNFGFALWAKQNMEALMRLGPGHHFGEWWGVGIQRGYQLSERRFSLFNVGRYTPEALAELNMGLSSPIFRAVPKLYEGPMSDLAIHSALDSLVTGGSFAVPGYMDPEGIVIFHTASGHLFKKTLKDDEGGKGKNG
jgi:hypothetical protein